jgi:hypothetical protein
VDENCKEKYNTHVINVSCIRNIKSAVNMWYKMILNYDPLKDTMYHLLSKGFLENHPIRPKYHTMWDLELVLYALKSFQLNEFISSVFECSQRKVVVFIAIYCLLRPYDMLVFAQV